MQKVLSKIISSLVVITLIAIQFLPVTVMASEAVVSSVDSNALINLQNVNMTTSNLTENEVGNAVENAANVANATNEITTPITDEMKTSENNVLANVTINDSYNAKAGIDDEINFKVYARVLNTGYLKDISVKIENNNYSIEKNTMENFKDVSLAEELTLNEVQADEEVEASVKAKFAGSEKVRVSDFNKESKITFNAVYVNEAGKERKIKKEFKINVEWEVKEAEETVYQELIRYIKFDNKTMISYRINDGIKENAIPVKEKEIKTIIPQINRKEPTIINIVGEYDEYKNENGTLVIKKNNAKENEEDKEYEWKTDDSYIVTYIYDAQEEQTSIKSNTEAKVKTILDKELTAKTELESQVANEVGSLIELDIEGTPSLNKGYMYTNLAREEKINTEFNTSYKINVGFKDIIDKVVLKETNYAYNEYKTEVINTKVNTHKEELVKVLGEEGTITIKDKEGNVIGLLNKDVEEVAINAEELTFETSKPQAEGILTVNIEEKMNDNIGYTREDIKLMQTLNTSATLEGYYNENVISNKNVVSTIKLEEPKSSADIAMEPRTLSTVVENQDVEINVRLNTADVEDALYTNPEIRIKLPDQVTGINITEGSLIYDKELVPASIRVEDNMIIANLTGTQTRYNSDGIINGSVVKILANISLDKMATSSNEKIVMGVANEGTGEIAQDEVDARVVATSGFITTNSIEISGVKEEAFKDNVEVEIDQGTSEKVAKISGKVVNNLEANADGFTVIGKLPVEGVQDFNGQDLETNITTRLNSLVNVQGLNAKVLYSENVNEGIDGTWSETPTATSKAFKIVALEEVPHAKSMTFDYDVVIPANVESGKSMTSLFGVFYKTNAVEGEQYNYVQSKTVGAFTEGNDTLSVDVQVYDKNDETKVINDNNTPKSGQDVTYKVTLANNGKTVINNINVVAELNNRLFFLNKTLEEGDNTIETADKVNKTKKDSIESMQAGESKVLYYNVRYDVALTRNYVLSEKIHNKIRNKQITDEEKLEILRTYTECDEEVVYKKDENGQIRHDIDGNPLTETIRTPRTTFEKYTEKMYENLEYGAIGGVYESVYNKLMELNDVTDEEVTEYNKAVMSIKASYGTNGVKKKTFNKEVVIQEYNSAYMNIIADNNKTLQTNEFLNVKVHLRSASIKKTGEITAYVNIPDGLKLVYLNSDGISTSENEAVKNMDNYYVRENNKVNYNKIAVPVKFMRQDGRRYLENESTASFTMKLQAKETTETKQRSITGYLEDKAYTIENDTITYGDTVTSNSNSVPVVIEKLEAFTAKQTANVEGVTSDSVPITFNINIKSESSIDRTIDISDAVPEKLVVKAVTLQVFDSNKNETVKSLPTAQGVVQNFVIPAHGEANVIIETTPKKMLKGESDLYINSPVIRSSGENISVNEYQIKVEGSVDPDTVPNTEDPTDPTGGDTVDPSKNYTLNGIVFIDEDYNGIRGNNDGRGKGNTLYLYKKIINNGKIANIELVGTTTTNGLGEYKFENVPVGEYYVIAEYDTKEYIVTKYKAENSENTNNNDFTEEKLDGKTVAAASANVTSTDLYNIDLGLATRKNFCFKLEKFVTGAKVLNSEYNTREYKFVNAHTAKIELPSKNVENTTVIAEYTIRITNIGKVAGTVESVVDELPSGMRFLGQENSGWYETQNGELINTTLSKKEMQSGDTVELKLTLTRSINGENLGLVRNVSEIKALSSKSASVPDGQTPGNGKDGEDDRSGADLIILLGTGRETASIVGITVTILALIACATYIMKKFVMDKSI